MPNSLTTAMKTSAAAKLSHRAHFAQPAMQESTQPAPPREDISTWLEKLAPSWPGYKHHQTGEDNADAHLKPLLLHHETTLPITRGRLDLGTWQRIFYAEFDGQRQKRIIVKVLGVTK